MPLRHPSPAVLALLAVVVALEPPPTPAAEADAPAPRVLAVRTAGDDGSLSQTLAGSWLFRRVLPRLEGWEGRVGPAATGDLTVLAGLLPLPAEARDLAAGLPVHFGDGGELTFDGTPYPARRLAAAFRLPPGRGAHWLVTGREPEAVESLLAQVGAMETGVHLWGTEADREADYLLRESRWMGRTGRWSRAGGGLGVDPAHDRDGFAERAGWFAGLAEIPAGRVRLRVAAGDRQRPQMRELAAELDRALAAMAPRVPAALETPLTVAVAPDLVLQGRFAGDIGEAVILEGPPADLILVYDPRDLAAYRFALARVLVRRARPGLPPWLEAGAALWLSGDWLGRPHGEWLPPLAAAGVLPGAEELLAAEEGDDAARLVWTPAAAALVARLPGATVAEKLHRVPGTPAVRALLAPLEGLAGETGAARRPEPAAGESRPAAHRPVGFLSGVSFAMLNGLEVGYHAPVVGQRLDRLARLGADAVSLMPFAYQPDPRGPEMRFLDRSPTSETDVGLLHAARRARERGFTVLWKPQIWVGHGSWPGEIGMESEADWSAWWRAYRRWIVHQAMLARWAEADILSLGVELGGTLEREEEWRRLIAAARLVFPGPLTYSANWWGDAEEAPFWDRLDFIGVDAYYPLASSSEASHEELVAGAREAARRLAELAARHRRPILLTEVGFASRRGAWVAPHEEGGDFSAADQATAYEALFTGLGRPPWLAGVFVWKAFSGERSGPARVDFRFLDRPAEEAVRRYFAAGREGRITAR